MTKEEKNKKLYQKFKNTFGQNILSATWEKEGMEVSFYNNKLMYEIIFYKDNF